MMSIAIPCYIVDMNAKYSSNYDRNYDSTCFRVTLGSNGIYIQITSLYVTLLSNNPSYTVHPVYIEGYEHV